MNDFTIQAKVWKYPGPASWHFVYVGKRASEALKKTTRTRIGWGYIPVTATLRKSSWKTTLFPTKEGPYLLAIKAAVRAREGVREGDRVRVRVSLI